VRNGIYLSTWLSFSRRPSDAPEKNEDLRQLFQYRLESPPYKCVSCTCKVSFALAMPHGSLVDAGMHSHPAFPFRPRLKPAAPRLPWGLGYSVFDRSRNEGEITFFLSPFLCEGSKRPASVDDSVPLAWLLSENAEE
jgi:hypothetical protein